MSRTFARQLHRGGRLFVDTGSLTGQATYTLLAFEDSSSGNFGVHHNFATLFGRQVTLRLRLSLGDTLVQSDDPTLADRLGLRIARQQFTSNLLSQGIDYSFGSINAREYYRLSTFTSSDTTTVSHTVGASLSSPIARINTVTLGYEYFASDTTNNSVTPFLVGGVIGDSTVSGHQWTGTFFRDWSVDRTVGLTAAYAIREETVNSVRTDFTRWNVAVFHNYFVADKLYIRGNLGVGQVTSSGIRPQLLLTRAIATSRITPALRHWR